MAINSRQVQTQVQQQVQTLSPQQILAVKLLELPTVELEERIHSELLDNPALEEGKEPSEQVDDHEDDYTTDEDGEPTSGEYEEDLSLGDYRTEDDIPDYKLQENNRSKGETPEEIPFRTMYRLRNIERAARHAGTYSRRKTTGRISHRLIGR